MIRADGKIENPEAIQMTLTVTMSIGEWAEIAAQLKTGSWWPHGKTASLIQEVIRKTTANVTEIARVE